ncbi:MAG TPA: hypothetical protein VEU11_01065 [Terriglobales bacterium]|nr:hypothetical protein [Terriglobales bacterium]
MLRASLFALLGAAVLYGQKYNGPQPEKADLPYLVHADNLVATESGTAKQETRKDDLIAVVEGTTSPAATPLASPIFLIRADKLAPNDLEIYRLESKNGRREVILTHKKKPVARPVQCTVSHVADDLYRLEVNDELPNGEYSITPRGSDQVFCFRVY